MNDTYHHDVETHDGKFWWLLLALLTAAADPNVIFDLTLFCFYEKSWIRALCTAPVSMMGLNKSASRKANAWIQRNIIIDKGKISHWNGTVFSKIGESPCICWRSFWAEKGDWFSFLISMDKKDITCTTSFWDLIMKKQNEDFMASYLGLQRETNLQYRMVCLVAKIFSSCFTF